MPPEGAEGALGYPHLKGSGDDAAHEGRCLVVAVGIRALDV